MNPPPSLRLHSWRRTASNRRRERSLNARSWVRRLRPRFSTLFFAGLAVLFTVLLALASLLGRSDGSGRTVVTVRLWDPQVAQAYRASFEEFSRTHPDLDVRVNVVP